MSELQGDPTQQGRGGWVSDTTGFFGGEGSLLQLIANTNISWVCHSKAGLTNNKIRHIADSFEYDTMDK